MRNSLSLPSKRDSIDLSKQSLNVLPSIPKMNIIVSLNISYNSLKSLPSMGDFVCLRYLNISYNNFSDLRQISVISSLKELDCSNNSLLTLDFVSELAALEVLNASNNKICEITGDMPDSLLDVDLSGNLFRNLESFQNSFSDRLQRLDLSNNEINEISNLRFLAIFSKLRVLRIGLLEKNRDLKLIPFIKHLCPLIEEFDDNDCEISNEDNAFNTQALLEVLLSGNESELREMLISKDIVIRWDEPSFVQFDNNVPETPLKGIEDRLRNLEERLPNTNESSILQPSDFSTSDIKKEIEELRKQVAKITEILFIHDAAMREIWEKE